MFCVHTFSVRSAAFSAEKRSDRRRNRFDIRRMAMASVGKGSYMAGAFHQEQMRWRVDHSATRHNCRPLSTRVNMMIYYGIMLNFNRIYSHNLQKTLDKCWNHMITKSLAIETLPF